MSLNSISDPEKGKILSHYLSYMIETPIRPLFRISRYTSFLVEDKFIIKAPLLKDSI